MLTDPIVITGIARTPLGNLLGMLKDLSATQLGATVIQASLERSELQPEQVQEVLMGCVLPAGQGQAPARQASIYAGLPVETGATTINKMCGSGMKAVMMAYDSIGMGHQDIMIAGGMESMTNAPHLIQARSGLRLGHGQLYDHMFLDGLEDAYEGQLMGCFGEKVAEHYQLSRQAQDDYAISSLQRAQYATQQGLFHDEIVPVTTTSKKTTQPLTQDENPLTADIDKITQLKPAFDPNGTITAANASSISDGAATLVLMRLSKAQQLGLQPLAKIHQHTSYAQQPSWFTTAPIHAIQNVLQRSGWSTQDVDLFEINEAFAAVAMTAMRVLNISRDQLNVHGGACALGHPIGTSGARILVTLINALRQHQLKRGVAGICIGGGEATAMTIELCDT